ncbi:hypothetical protein F4777DRAFT_36969 [Nemania sp. FL0916]|nr:hypothetical protein F4777DRAFT_36969 [Nemania sp. FL0916]
MAADHLSYLHGSVTTLDDANVEPQVFGHRKWYQISCLNMGTVSRCDTFPLLIGFPATLISVGALALRVSNTISTPFRPPRRRKRNFVAIILRYTGPVILVTVRSCMKDLEYKLESPSQSNRKIDPSIEKCHAYYSVLHEVIRLPASLESELMVAKAGHLHASWLFWLDLIVLPDNIHYGTSSRSIKMGRADVVPRVWHQLRRSTCIFKVFPSRLRPCSKGENFG